MRHENDAKIYKSFEEFEREELRRMDAVGSTVDDYLDDLFADDLDSRHAGANADDEEEE